MNNHHSEILNIYFIKTQEFEALFSKTNASGHLLQVQVRATTNRGKLSASCLTCLDGKVADCALLYFTNYMVEFKSERNGFRRSK